MRYLKFLLLFAVFIGFALFLRSTDWQAVADALRRIGWNALWMIFFTFLSAFLGAAAWHYCITQGREKLSFFDLFFIRHIGETVGGLNPTGIIAGDGLKANMLTQKGITAEVALTSIVVSRSLTMLSHFAVFILAGLFINPIFGAKIASVFIGIGLVIWLVYRIFRPVWKQNKAHWLSRMQTRNWHKIIGFGRSMREQFRLLLRFDRKSLWIAFVILALHWVMGAAEFLVIVRLLGTKINLADAVLIDAGVGFFKALGILVPGQLGFEEYGNKFMLETVGVTDQSLWITASILRRSRQVFWILFGLAAYFIGYHKIKPQA